MNFKKTTIAISILGFLASSANFVVIVDKDSNEYEIGDFTTKVEYSEWIDVSESNCSYDIDNDLHYYGEAFNQVETCDLLQERDVTTTTTYNDGNIVVDVVQESQTIENEKESVIAYGTHLESTCKGIQSFNISLSSGEYVIKPDSSNMNVYCDMDTSGGGWTIISKESNGGINEALYTNYPVNEGSPTAATFRMSKSNMTLIQSLSSEMRLDCRGSDHLEMASSNVFNGEGGPNSCNNNTNVLYTSASLKGNLVKNKTICTWNTGTGSGAGKGCAGAFHIDETAQYAYGCGLTNYPWTGSAIVVGSADTFALYAGTKDATTDCHKSGAERFIMLR